MRHPAVRFIALGLALAACCLAACTYGVGDSASEKPAPSDSAYSVGGTVAGLAGTGLVLQDNGGDNLSISANGAFTFPASLPPSTLYNVSVLTQPVGADGTAQTCTVANGTGAITADVTNVAVSCAAKPAASASTDTIGGSVAGLAGSGLVLQNSDGKQVAVSGNGPFTLESGVAPGTAYAVTVLSPPTDPDQVCSVTNGTGTTGSADVSSIVVSCQTTSTTTKSYAIGGTVTGLTGTGASVVLEDNGRDAVTVSADGTFTFPLLVPSGSAYSVSEQAAGGTESLACTLSNASGVVGNASVTNVTVTCEASTQAAFTVGGTVTGLTGTGASLVLEDNGGDNLTVTADGAFTFPTPVLSGGAYSVTLTTTGNLTCQLTNATGVVGTAAVTTVGVTCQVPGYTVGGTVTGLSGTGASVVLEDNGKDALTLAADGAFSFGTPVLSGNAYSVTIQTSVGGVTCSLANASGTMGSANVTNVSLTCQLNTYTVGGTVTGLSGTGASLALQDNGGDTLTLTADGSFTFNTPLVGGASYAVTDQVTSAAVSISCTVSNGSGVVGSANITSIAVTCQPSQFTIGGTVTGLSGTGGSLQLQDNGGDTLTVSADGAFTFATPIASGAPYSVSLQATGSVNCTLANGSGTVGSGNVTNVTVTCLALVTLPVTVTGLRSSLPAQVTAGTATALVLTDNAGDQLTITSNGNYAFATPLVQGTQFTVSVTTQPGVALATNAQTPQTDIVCELSSASGEVEPGTAISVLCVDHPLGFAYVTNGADNTVSSYVVTSNGTPVQFGAPMPTGTNPSALTISTSEASSSSPFAAALYVTNAGSNDLSVYNADTNLGVVTPAGTVTGFTDPTAVAVSDIFTPVTNSDTGYLVVTNGGAPGSASILNVSSSLTSPPFIGSPVATGNGPAAIVFAQPNDPTNNCTSNPLYAYIANSQDGTISLYTVSASGLTPGAQTYPAGAGPASFAEGVYYGGETVSSLIYAANADDGSLSEYQATCADGSLTSLGSVQVGSGLKSVVFSIVVPEENPGGNGYIYATSQAGVTGFLVNNGASGTFGALGPAIGPTPLGTAPGPISTIFLSSSETVTNLTTSTTVTLSAPPSGDPVVPGMYVVDDENAFPPGTTVVAVSDDQLTITLSQAPTAAEDTDDLEFEATFVYVVDTAAGTITTLQANAETGALTQVGTPVPTGQSPTALYTAPRSFLNAE